MSEDLTFCQLPKLHHKDPSGEWNLVRMGINRPQVGQEILFVKDIRGTTDELTYNNLVKVSEGDPYKITNDALREGKRVLGGAVGDVMAEMFKLPTKAYKPTVHFGKVVSVNFDIISEEWWIDVAPPHEFMAHVKPEHIVYWKPLGEAPETFTPRGDYDLYYTNALDRRERAEWEAKHPDQDSYAVKSI